MTFVNRLFMYKVRSDVEKYLITGIKLTTGHSGQPIDQSERTRLKKTDYTGINPLNQSKLPKVPI